MKALLYKEFKLAMHPICYLFMFLFPVMMLIPGYPIAVGFIYILAAYPILFLGANKGQQSNDLLYSTLLPVRKKDIVLARMITVAMLQFVFIGLMCALFPLAKLINESIPSAHIPGLDLNGFVSILGIAIVGYALADLIFFPIYYKHGRSIVMSTLLTILGFIVYLGVFTIGLPYAPIGYKEFFEGPLWTQFIVLGVSLGLYVAIHIIVYIASSKLLQRVDF